MNIEHWEKLNTGYFQREKRKRNKAQVVITVWNNFNFYHNVLLITILNCFPHQSLMETHTDISTIHILAHKPPASLINIKRNFFLSQKKKKNLINCFGANLNFSIMALSVSGLIFFCLFVSLAHYTQAAAQSLKTQQAMDSTTTFLKLTQIFSFNALCEKYF